MTFKQVRKQTTQPQKARKSKFQADLAAAEDSMVRGLKEELQLGSNTDFLSDAVALFRWAVGERRRGHRIFSESEKGERKELVFPRLERVAPGLLASACRDLLDHARTGEPCRACIARTRQSNGDAHPGNARLSGCPNPPSRRAGRGRAFRLWR